MLLLLLADFQIIHLAAGGAALPALPRFAVAQVQTGAIAIEEATIANLQAAYMAGRTTVRAVTQAHLDRIAVYDKRGPLINSLITVNSHALDEADRLDAQLRTTGGLVGPLHGIPVVVKDNLDVAGLPMTAGFQGWKNYYPPEDAPLIKRIRAAGGIILAKASLSEFTRGIGDNINSVLPGFARNPYNTASGQAAPPVAPGRLSQPALRSSGSGPTPAARCAHLLPTTPLLACVRPSALYHAPA